MSNHSPMRSRRPDSPPDVRFHGGPPPPPSEYHPSGPPPPPPPGGHPGYPPQYSYSPPGPYGPPGYPPLPRGHQSPYPYAPQHAPYGYGGYHNHPASRGGPAFPYPGYESPYPPPPPGHSGMPSGPPPNRSYRQAPPPPSRLMPPQRPSSPPKQQPMPLSNSPKGHATTNSPQTPPKSLEEISSNHHSQQHQHQQRQQQQQQQPHRSPPMDIADVERLRAAAETIITHDDVKPIQSDYHFFVKEKAATYRKEAEAEVRKSQALGDLDPFMINTNLNTKLKRAWEALSNEERHVYVVKEENDRHRFMEEDEIASRHCATLTSRTGGVRSKGERPNEVREEEDTPRPLDEASSKDDMEKNTVEKGKVKQHLEDSHPKRTSSDDQGESPAKKSRLTAKT